MQKVQCRSPCCCHNQMNSRMHAAGHTRSRTQTGNQSDHSFYQSSTRRHLKQPRLMTSGEDARHLETTRFPSCDPCMTGLPWSIAQHSLTPSSRGGRSFVPPSWPPRAGCLALTKHTPLLRTRPTLSTR